MKKKWIAAAVILAAMALCIFGAESLKPKTASGNKTIYVTIVNEVEDTELFSGELNTEAETLGEMLDESKELKAVMEEGSFGRLLVSLMDLQQGDMAAGPWWLYESENNEACKASGFCPAVDDTPIQDQDRFKFKYTDTY